MYANCETKNFILEIEIGRHGQMNNVAKAKIELEMGMRLEKYFITFILGCLVRLVLKRVDGRFWLE